MRFTLWVFSIAFCTSLLVAGQAQAETSDSDNTQHDALDDAALEEKYGIKAGAVQREEPISNDAEETSGDESNHSGNEEDTQGGTGGTVSAEDAIESGEDEQSNSDNE